LKRLRVKSKWRWAWVAGGALWMFAVLAFAYPAATGERIDAAWTIIAAVVSVVWAVSAQYLTERRRKRKGKRPEE
jgi:drug/metabolite transporter superfamily protein YnfA